MLHGAVFSKRALLAAGGKGFDYSGKTVLYLFKVISPSWSSRTM